MPDVTGGCLCGRVRYVVTSEPVISGLCHCRSCQRYTGSAFEAAIAYPAASVTVRGELTTYVTVGDSGQPIRRCFCANCGSGVINKLALLPDLTIVLAGTLDDPSLFKPTIDAFWSNVQPWFHSGGERTRFLKMPV